MNSQRLACATLAVVLFAGCGGGRSTRDASPADVPAYADLAADVATLADLATTADTADAADPRRDVNASTDATAAAGDATEVRAEASVPPADVAEPPVDGAAGDRVAAEPAMDGAAPDLAVDRTADGADAATIEVGGDQRLPTDQSGTEAAVGDPETEELRALCLATGGMVVTIPCCSGTAPFPTTCPYLNRCGCATEYLVPKEICECPANTCFELWPRVGCQ